jgi:hypothetical protein
VKLADPSWCVPGVIDNVVCGFAFDPLAGEEAGEPGRLTILSARIRPIFSSSADSRGWPCQSASRGSSSRLER